ADWAASARRVASLELALDGLERAEIRRGGRIARGGGEEAALRLRGVSVPLDDGTAVVEGAGLATAPGGKGVLMGDSGTGKSTVARALAGVWPWGRGDIEIAAGRKLLVLSQRPYVPTGTLRRAVNYPDAAHSRSMAVEKVELGYLAGRLDEEG